MSARERPDRVEPDALVGGNDFCAALRDFLSQFPAAADPRKGSLLNSRAMSPYGGRYSDEGHPTATIGRQSID